MGANPSKPGERCVAPPSRKHLKSRSSLNLLKRTRTPSTATRASCPLPETVPVGGPPYTKIRNNAEEQVSPEYQPSSSNASALSSTSERREDGSDPDSASQYSTPETVTRPTTPINGHGKGEDASTPQSEDSRPGTPALSLTPKTLLAPPAMLPEDSPTKYGLRTRRTPSPEKGMTRAQRMKITGPGLFAVCPTVAQRLACISDSSDL
ncbi:hypothetical protein BDV97DRAFT_118562 [Delphinella strobiligena]|nr:hypothetical protein BDV97DRAFT_118562 [Delphinella strobiligena]